MIDKNMQTILNSSHQLALIHINYSKFYKIPDYNNIGNQLKIYLLKIANINNVICIIWPNEIIIRTH